MGAEAIWIPLVLGAVSAGTSYYNNRQQARRADNIAMQSLRQNEKRQQRADAVTQQLIADTAASTPEKERKGAMQGFMDQLMRARNDSHSGVQDMSGASSAFSRDAAAASLGIDQQGQNYADLASRLDSPFLQRRREADDRTNAGIDLSLLGREQEGDNRVTDARLRAVRGNPWLEALSAVTGAAAGSYSGGGKGAGASGSFTPSANSMLDPSLGSAWGGNNSLIWGSYGGLR